MTASLGGVGGVIAILGFLIPMFILMAYFTYDQNKKKEKKPKTKTH